MARAPMLTSRLAPLAHLVAALFLVPGLVIGGVLGQGPRDAEAEVRLGAGPGYNQAFHRVSADEGEYEEDFDRLLRRFQRRFGQRLGTSDEDELMLLVGDLSALINEAERRARAREVDLDKITADLGQIAEVSEERPEVAEEIDRAIIDIIELGHRGELDLEDLATELEEIQDEVEQLKHIRNQIEKEVADISTKVRLNEMLHPRPAPYPR